MQLARAVSCAVALAGLALAPGFFWVIAIPWMILNILGLGAVVILALVALVASGAGGAQADWMSDTLVTFTFLILPTLASIAISEFFARFDPARNEATTNAH